MRVQVGDVKLFVEVFGPKLVQDGWDWRSRPTLVLLPGGPGFDHLALRQPGFGHERLADAAQLVFVDPRGCGSSDVGDPSTWTLARFASDIVELCRVLEIDRPVLLGESGGGFLALEVLRQAPDLLGGLVLVNTTARWSIERVTEAFRRVGGDAAADVARDFWADPGQPGLAAAYAAVCMPLYSSSVPYSDLAPPPSSAPRDVTAEAERIRYNHQLFTKVARDEMSFDYLEELRKTKLPVLVVAGAKDPVCPVEDSDDIAAAAADASYLRVEEAGHDVAAVAPDRFRQAVVEYLRTLSSKNG